MFNSATIHLYHWKLSVKVGSLSPIPQLSSKKEKEADVLGLAWLWAAESSLPLLCCLQSKGPWQASWLVVPRGNCCWNSTYWLSGWKDLGGAGHLVQVCNYFVVWTSHREIGADVARKRTEIGRCRSDVWREPITGWTTAHSCRSVPSSTEENHPMERTILTLPPWVPGTRQEACLHHSFLMSFSEKVQEIHIALEIAFFLFLYRVQTTLSSCQIW